MLSAEGLYWRQLFDRAVTFFDVVVPVEAKSALPAKACALLHEMLTMAAAFPDRAKDCVDFGVNLMRRLTAPDSRASGANATTERKASDDAQFARRVAFYALIIQAIVERKVWCFVM